MTTNANATTARRAYEKCFLAMLGPAPLSKVPSKKKERASQHGPELVTTFKHEHKTNITRGSATTATVERTRTRSSRTWIKTVQHTEQPSMKCTDGVHNIQDSQKKSHSE
eukprot:340629-Hanusia_phi.AAC.6